MEFEKEIDLEKEIDSLVSNLEEERKKLEQLELEQRSAMIYKKKIPEMIGFIYRNGEFLEKYVKVDEDKYKEKGFRKSRINFLYYSEFISYTKSVQFSYFKITEFLYDYALYFKGEKMLAYSDNGKNKFVVEFLNEQFFENILTKFIEIYYDLENQVNEVTNKLKSRIEQERYELELELNKYTT
jgi:hypothetical protein